jgi:hypothetical protein
MGSGKSNMYKVQGQSVRLPFAPLLKIVWVRQQSAHSGDSQSLGFSMQGMKAICPTPFAESARVLSICNRNSHCQLNPSVLTCTSRADVYWIALFLTLCPLLTPEAQGAAEAPVGAAIG